METILIADDHEIVRCGIRTMIEGLTRKYHITETATCAGVMQALSDGQVQYLILDMNLSDGNLFNSLDEIAACYSHIHILVYSMNAENIYARRLIQKGIRGFVNKQAAMGELKKAIGNLLNGVRYLSPALKEHTLSPSKANFPGNPIDALSDRELEVAEYMITGKGAKEIANRMSLDITTVSTYRKRAFEKLEVQNIIELKEKFVLYRKG